SLLEVAADAPSNPFDISSQIRFSGPSELVVDHVAAFGAGIWGPVLMDFGGAGESIDLKDLSFVGLGTTYDVNTGGLTLVNGTEAPLRFAAPTLVGSAFHFADDGSGHVLITHT